MSASFSLDNSEVVRAVLQVMGLGRDAANMDDATEADVRAVIRSGLRRFYFPVANGQTYQWRFLESHLSLNVVAVFDDGTVEVSGGTVTLTGGTWPSDMTNYFIRVSGHVLFVTERTDDNNVEVSNTQLTVASGTSYDAYKYRYALPSDFGEFLGGVVYADGDDLDGTRMLAGSSESEIRLRYAVGQGTSVRTTHYAVTHTPDASGPTIVLWPVPAPDAFLTGTYLAIPEDNLPADLTTPGSVVQVKPIYAEAVLEAILSAAEEYNNDMHGVHTARFQAAIQTAIMHDKAVGGAYDFSNRVVDPRSHGTVLPIDFQQ